MSRPLKVFLCHASQDKPAVREIYNTLKAEGWIDPWLDKAKILPGQDWEMVIEKAVDDSDVVIVCLSNQSVPKEGFVQREIRYAYDIALEKPEDTIFLIPLRLDDCTVPRKLRTLHWVDFFGSQSQMDESASELLEALKLRHEQVLRLEADELERRRLEEKARQEADELIRKSAAEKIAREQADREAIKKAEHERLERETLEKAALEKAERERPERDAAEKLAREKVEREKEELVVAEKAIWENEERKVTEKIARLKAEREEIEREKRELANKAESEKHEREIAAKAAHGKNERKPVPKGKFRWLGLGGTLISCLLLAIYSRYYLTEKPPSMQTETPIAIVSTATKTKTPAPTKTFTPAPLTFTPTPGIGSTMISDKDGMILVYVPEGEFTMGSDADEILLECQKYELYCLQSRFTDEEPPHNVNLDSFWIDQTEVTNAMYAKCVADGDCTPPSSTNSFSQYDDYPVTYVDWDQAKAYCTWTGRELPTEAKWEKAARGEEGRTYPWGDGIDCGKANYSGCVGRPTKVGNYPAGKSIYGALDMAGNVWEWVSSRYKPYPYKETDGREDLTSSGSRVLRGGAWDTIDFYVRSAERDTRSHVALNFIGFRCSLSQP